MVSEPMCENYGRTLSRMRYFLSVLLCCFVFTVTKAYTIRGVVLDAADDSTMPEATVRLLNQRDSSFVKGVAANIDGVFTIANVSNGRYILEANYIGYEKCFMNITVRNADPARVTMKLGESSIKLSEATVTAVKTPIKVMEDTIEFNADSYTTQPNAVVEDLLKRLPGVEVDSDGGITANGKTVSKILIDGKEFFSDDPKVASKNLPVDMIEKLQVVDRKSDLARLTGVDDGEDETVINLTVKKDMKNGWFGTVLGGYGTDSRYTANFNINKFWNGNQITFLGNANNINELGFTDSNGSRFNRFGGTRGINNSQAFGINFNVGKEEIFRVGGDVMYSHSNRYTYKLQNREYILEGIDPYFMNSTSSADDVGHNVRADLRMQWNPDSFNVFDFRPRFSFNQNESNINEFSVTENRNMNQNVSSSLGRSYEFGGRLIYTHNFASHRGRSLSVFANYSFSNVRENSPSYSFYRYLYNLTTADDDEAEADWEAYEQMSTRHTWTNNVSGRFSWTEPLGAASNGNFLTLAYQASMRWNNADRLVSQRDAESLTNDNEYHYTLTDGEYLIPGPVWGSNPFEPMTDLSSEYRYKYFNQDIRVGYKKVSRLFNLDLGLSLVPQMSSSKELTGSKQSIPERWVWNFAPYMRARIKWSAQRSMQVFYTGRSSQPSMNQLQPVPDTSDPLNITQGNPNLKPYFNHNVMVRFQDFNLDSQRSIMLMANVSMTQNSIVSRTDYDDVTGGRITTYQNVNGVWSARIMNMFSMPFRNKAWTFNNNIFVNFNQGVGFSNVSKNDTENVMAGAAVKNISRSLMFNESFQIAFRPQNLELALRPRISLQKAWYTVKTPNMSNTLNYTYGAMFNATYNSPIGIVLSSDLDWSQTGGYAQGYNQKQWMWNAQIAYEFLAGRSATIALKVYDLLRQKNNVSRSYNDQYIDNTMYNSLTRYFMLTFTYRFNTFGKGNQPQGRERRGFGGPGGFGGRPGGPPRR